MDDQWDILWGHVKDTAVSILGQMDADISIGGGKPASATIAFGERRVMSALALCLVALLFFAIGSRFARRKG